MSLDDIELSISLRLQLLMAFSTAVRRNIFISQLSHTVQLWPYSTLVCFYKKLIYKLQMMDIVHLFSLFYPVRPWQLFSATQYV